jgi:hypothetical protein
LKSTLSHSGDHFHLLEFPRRVVNFNIVMSRNI